jgi:enoyl-[acyl-carrier protein] reductase/trans-2-enoyl-CoA reductase (NAD+)
MTARIIRPAGRGFLLLDSHPAGCARTVEDMWDQVAPASTSTGRDRRPVALVIGSSAGYGLAATVAGLARYGIRGVGLCFEKAPTQRRTGTAGWYRTIATARLSEQAGSDMVFVNADAFADTTKTEVLDLIAHRYGPVDYLVYSIAAPRRTDPATSITYASVIKPIGAAYRTKSLVFDGDGTAELKESEVSPAEGDDIEQTVKVMGGEDWSRWVDALADRELLAPGFTTVALSYIGSELTSAIYRQGTIGAAKNHLEHTARNLNTALADTCKGVAVTSVNGAAVTQSSTAIPGIALYVGLLRAVMGEAMQPPITQLVDLWDQLAGTRPLDTDEHGRIRLDSWELTEHIQTAVADRWKNATADTIGDLADLDWFRDEFRRLYGFAVPGVDYDQPTEPEQPWPITIR